MEIEYTTIKKYLTEMYSHFCKEYGINLKQPSVGFAMNSMFRDRALDDLIILSKEQGVGATKARIQDKENNLRPGCGIETFLESFTVEQELVVCTTKDFYVGLSEPVDKQVKKLAKGLGDHVAWKLDKQNRVTLINDPTALDESGIDTLPDTFMYASRGEHESPIEYASRIAEEAENNRMKAMEDLANSTGSLDGPTDESSDDDEEDDGSTDIKAGFNRIKSINDYFGFPDA